MTVTQIHPETGKPLRRDVRPQVVRFGAAARVVDVPGWHPDDDGDSMHSGADPAESDRIFREMRDACVSPRHGARSGDTTPTGTSATPDRTH
ncbi:hypothetical protein [Amaricoccus sp.]|uniref:hypothetical protein n=1 Tax=Amaricoccus sp. TaxID=1872485 RepID=UPI001B4EABE8|nr:hypothetical protein [Amaricoccus sp.]MBP7000274.1 hypothetical protein [Amaricoccus sp.]